MAVASPARRSALGALVPELDCPPRPGGGPGAGPGGCDVCALLGDLPALLAHAFAIGTVGSNRGILLSDDRPAQIGYRNPGRVALGITIPAGAIVYHGFTNRVSPTPNASNAGTPVPSGASWIFGPEWTGDLWVVSPGPYGPDGIDVRIVEISA